MHIDETVNLFGIDNQLYKPIQLYHLDLVGINCRLLQADEDLQREVYYYWVLDIEDKEVSLPVIPDGAVDLVFSTITPDFSALYFPRPQKYNIPLVGPARYVGVCFRPDKAISRFSASLSQLSALEAGYHTTKTLGLAKIALALQGHTSDTQIAYLLNCFLSTPSETLKISGHLHMISLIENLDVGSVAYMAKQVGLSERQFRRTTGRLFGLSPKQLHKIVRLQKLLNELIGSTVTRHSNDYFDESHLIKELKNLTGLTPTKIRQMAEKYNTTDI